MESLVAMKTLKLGRVERKKMRVDGDICDPWEKAYNMDFTELECAFEIAAWQRKSVDKQRPTPSH